MRSARCGRIAALAVLALVAGCSRPAPVELPPRPNLLLVSIDSLRPDHLGAYGYARPTSPRLDRLASEGIVFDRAWSVTSWTLPSHLSMLSGLLPPVHGVRRLEGQSVSAAITLLPEALAGAGYRSAAVVSGLYLDRRFGYDQGWEIYDDRSAFGDGSLHEHQVVSSERVYRRAVELLDRLAPGPFLLFAHFFDVHYDYAPPPPYDRIFDPGYRGPVSGANFVRDVLVRREMPARDLEHLRALYDGEIRWVDGWLGKLLDELDRRGLAERTLVVVVSDHGEEFLEHGRFGHAQNLYDTTLRVPMIVRLPGARGGGRRLADPVSLVDLAPTLAAAAGAPRPARWSGRDLLPALTGQGGLPSPGLFADLFKGHRAVIVDGRWKGILARRRQPGQPRGFELYDLERDRLERRQLAAAERARGDELRLELERAFRAFRRAARGIEAGEIQRDPAFERELRALGYL